MGTNPIATWLLTTFTTQDPTTYKGTIDGNFAVAQRIVDVFAPHAQTSPNMTIRLDAGSILSGVTLTEVAAQNTGTITAPVSNSRIDRVVIGANSGTVSVITGTPGVSPAVPAITAGKLPVAQILLTSSSTSITNAMITDERNLAQAGIYQSYQPLASNLTDLAALSPTVNTFVSFSATNVIKQTAAQAKSSLSIANTDVSGLGTASTLNVGTSANQVVQLNGSAQLPAVSGALLTNLPAASGSNVAKAWVNFKGQGTVTINSSLNVSSITDNGTGDYTVNFSSSLSNANYAYAAGNEAGPSGYYLSALAGSLYGGGSGSYQSKSTSAMRFVMNAANGGAIDSFDNNLIFFGT